MRLLTRRLNSIGGGGAPTEVGKEVFGGGARPAMSSRGRWGISDLGRSVVAKGIHLGRRARSARPLKRGRFFWVRIRGIQRITQKVIDYLAEGLW